MKYSLVIVDSYRMVDGLLQKYTLDCTNYKYERRNATIKTERDSFIFIKKDIDPRKICAMMPHNVIWETPESEVVLNYRSLYITLIERVSRRGSLDNFKYIQKIIIFSLSGEGE